MLLVAGHVGFEEEVAGEFLSFFNFFLAGIHKHEYI